MQQLKLGNQIWAAEDGLFLNNRKIDDDYKGPFIQVHTLLEWQLAAKSQTPAFIMDRELITKKEDSLLGMLLGGKSHQLDH